MTSICEKHKLPINYLCTLFDCQKERLLCYKCKGAHKQHSQSISLLENMTDKPEMEFLNLKSITKTRKRNNKSGFSSNDTSFDNNDSSFVQNNFANLSIKSPNSKEQNDKAFKRKLIRNSQSKETEFKTNPKNLEENFLNFEAKENTFLDDVFKNELQQNNIAVMEDENDEFNRQNIKSTSTETKEEKLNKNNLQLENKHSKNSMYASMAESDLFQHCQRPQKSQNNSTQSKQESKNQGYLQQDSKQHNQTNMKMNSEQNIQAALNSPNSLSVGGKFEQNQFVNELNSLYNQEIVSKQNQSGQVLQHLDYLRLQHSLANQNSSRQKMEEETPNLDLKPTANKNRNAQKQIVTNKKDTNQKDDILNNKKQIKSNHENEFLYEVMKQDENVQKICLFLRSMNDMKKSLCAKIDRIKTTFLNVIQMKEEDFSYSYLFDQFQTNKTLIEERLKNSFTKFKLLTQFFDNNQIVYNPSATNRSKQYQLEKDIDRMFSFSLKQIDSEQQKECKKIQELLVDPSQGDQYAELFKYYNQAPAKIEEVQDKVNIFQAYQIEFDGISKGNPGKSSAGFLIRDTISDKSIFEYSIDVGFKMFNQAQYLSLAYAMLTCQKLGIRQVRIQSDSEIVIKQMQGIYKVRSEYLKEYYNLIKILDENFHTKEYILVKKELNSDANAIAVSALI